jgi:hypothetical protein
MIDDGRQDFDLLAGAVISIVAAILILVFKE